MRAASGLIARGLRLAVFGIISGLLAGCELPSLGGLNGPRVNTKEPVTVALLVPRGSGDPNLETLANSLVRAAKLAVSDLEGAVIDLNVYHTGGNATRAVKVAQQAVTEGSKIIVGPLFAEAANAVGVALAGENINILAFSNNTEIAGGNVFVLGNTFQNTANRIVGYAARQGVRNVAAVVSKDVAGEIGAAAVQNAAIRAGANFTGTSRYTLSSQGIVAAIPGIKNQVRSTGTNAIVFSASTTDALPMLAQLLPENGVNPASVKFMGMTRWDIPAQALGQSGLQGGWFALPDPGVYANYSARYKAAYGSAPTLLSGIAFDGIAAVGALLKTGASNALTRRKLTRRSGFAGVSGVFRLLSDGTNQRSLAIAEVSNGRVRIIDPAPRGFGAGS